MSLSHIVEVLSQKILCRYTIFILERRSLPRETGHVITL